MHRSIFYGLFLTLLVVGGSVFYIVKKAFSKEFFAVLMQADKRYILISVFFMLLYHTFDNLRLFVLARTMKLRYTFFYGYVVSFINTFGATITPAHLGGEFMSLYTLSRKGGKLHKVMSIVTMKTITGLTFFLIAFPYAGYQMYKNPQDAIRLFYVVAFFVLLGLFLYGAIRFFIRKNHTGNRKLSLKIKYTLKRYLVVLRLFLRKGRGGILGACLSSFMLYVCFLLSGAFLIKSFNQEAELIRVVESQLLLLYAIFISPTPGGSGVGEVGALYVFEPFLGLGLLGGFSILWRFITQYLSAMVGGILLSLMLLIDAKKFRNA